MKNKLRIFVLVGLVSMVNFVIVVKAQVLSNNAKQLSDLDVVKILFNHATKPVPNKMRLAAQVEVTSENWTENQVLDYVNKLESKLNDSNPKLREYRIQYARKSHSGIVTNYLQEWFDGREIWRGDKSDSAVNPSFDPEKNKYFQSMVNYSKSNNITTLTITPEAKSAAFNAATSSKWSRFDLWEAYIIEPNAGLPIVTELLDKSRSVNLENRLNTSYEGLVFSASKAKKLLSGEDENVQLQVSRVASTSKSLEMLVVTLKINNVGLVASYYLDARNLDHILKIEMSDGLGNRYLSERDRFDKNDFPWLWVVRTEENAKPASVSRHIFSIADLDGLTVNESVFSPTFPTDYTVVRQDPTGTVFLQNPNHTKLVSASTDLHLQTPPQAIRFKIRMIIILMLFITSLSIFLIFNKAKNANK
jgi:hypothetical protein